MRIHNIAIDDAGIDGAETDARVPLDGVMDPSSHRRRMQEKTQCAGCVMNCITRIG